jgi:hypothetical protein
VRAEFAEEGLKVGMVVPKGQNEESLFSGMLCLKRVAVLIGAKLTASAPETRSRRVRGL